MIDRLIELEWCWFEFGCHELSPHPEHPWIMLGVIGAIVLRLAVMKRITRPSRGQSHVEQIESLTHV